MPRRRATASVSFKNERKKKEAIAKSKERGRTLSGQVQKYFDNLSFLSV